MNYEEDDSICPICDKTTYVGETISCETCNLWFHFICVGVTHRDEVVQRQDVPFFCPKCLPHSKQLNKKKTSNSSFSSSPKDGKRKRRDKEEEEWLDAVESGTLNEVVDPELKNIKDPKLMTARQRAMAERQLKGEHNSSDVEDHRIKEEDDIDESIKQQKAIKSAKRKELEMEKRELDKKKTMDRLLKKRDSKATKLMKSSRTGLNKGPILMTYKISKDGSRTMNMAHGVEYPLSPSTIPCTQEDLKVKLCGNCKMKPKVYSCSKTLVPLCSIECYKANIEKVSQ
ncbi:uncharacterized protein [Lepeophtheirus salmonis]|uniref:uncharacterized protein n=1 Tax=Lepeophtheirus salmonis TaxID=72036 RepID=UPI001AE343F5|nr:INO80 complex subunit B-like [Lepeophtheirus salmonis]